MSGLFGINSSYFKSPAVQTTPSEDVIDEDGFVLVNEVEQVALPVILENTTTPSPPPPDEEELELSTSIPNINPTTASTSQVLATPSSSSSSSSSASTASTPLPYIFERTDNWVTQSSGDPHLKIEGPDKDGDIFIQYGDQSLSINTIDPGTYRIQVLSQKINVEFIP